MGEIIQFYATTPKGNGAREKLQEYFSHDWDTELLRYDHMLAWLWVEGFKIVPLDGTEG